MPNVPTVKGVVFNLFEDFVVAHWGPQAYEDILAAAKPACPIFVGPGTYPDQDLYGLVAAACAAHKIEPKAALRSFGRHAFPHLARKVSDLVECHSSLRSFLYSVDEIIHVEVHKLMTDAVVPRLQYVDLGPDRLLLKYRSERNLCAFMEGLLEGAAAFFETEIRYQHDPCKHAGHDHCGFTIEFLDGPLDDPSGLAPTPTDDVRPGAGAES